MRFCGMISAAGFVALTIATTSTRAQDWPQWRGPNGDARVTGFEAPKAWPQALHQQWKVTVGQADATPALAGGKLYVFSRAEDNEVIRCLDAATGKELWSDKYETMAATGAAGSHPGPRSSPTLADGKVVTFGVRGTLSCYEAASGKMLWRKDDLHGWPKFFTSASPLVTDGMCIAQIGSPTNGAIVAYDLATGAQKWRWDGDGPGYASPAAMTVGGTRLVVAQTDKRVVAVSLADGKLVWETPFAPSGMGGANCITPVIDGQTIIYSGSGRGTIAVKLDKTGETFAATPVWTNKEIAPRFCTPVLKDGFLYGIGDNKSGFYCMDAKTGKTAWSDPTARGPFGSILDAGSTLIALTPKQQLIVIQPSEKAYNEVASIKVADSDTYSQPVLAGKRLYIEDQNSVILWTLD